MNAPPDKRLTGRIARERIRMLTPPPAGAVERFKAIREVLDLAERKATAEDVRCKAIDGGIAVPDISRATYGEK